MALFVFTKHFGHIPLQFYSFGILGLVEIYHYATTSIITPRLLGLVEIYHYATTLNWGRFKQHKILTGVPCS